MPKKASNAVSRITKLIILAQLFRSRGKKDTKVAKKFEELRKFKLNQPSSIIENLAKGIF